MCVLDAVLKQAADSCRYTLTYFKRQGAYKHVVKYMYFFLSFWLVSLARKLLQYRCMHVHSTDVITRKLCPKINSSVNTSACIVLIIDTNVYSFIWIYMWTRPRVIR